MAKLPPASTLDLINDHMEYSLPRPHLGASIIGHPCMRYLVYSFYWAYQKETPSKLKRIFKMGDDIEEVIIDALTSTGIHVFNTQDRFTDYTGHVGGSVDGFVRDVVEYPDETLLLEAKSMNNNNFTDVQRKGVQDSKPVYYSQMQRYMGEFELDKAMFVALNKNTAELYIEFVNFDENHYQILLIKEKEILNAESIDEFPRISNTASWYQCKFCDAKKVCFDNARVNISCRTCSAGTPTDRGTWWCAVHSEERNPAQQATACLKWGQSVMFDGT